MNTEPSTIWHKLPFDRAALERYLSTLYQTDVHIRTVRAFESDETDEDLKELGYGHPLLVEFVRCDVESGGEREERIVLHTMATDQFGHERRSDRARHLLLDHETFNDLPRHAPSLDVGAIGQDSTLISLGAAGEFFHVSKYVPGELYAHDLPRIAAADRASPNDENRVLVLADYLAQIHAQKMSDATLYRRRVRDLLGDGEGIMGMTDSYPADFELAPPTRLQAIEERCLAWRWRIKERSDRLSQVHGDFHPWNILFQEGNEFALLDRSRGAWGEPADDVSALSINYILFGLRQHEKNPRKITGPFRHLFEQFWSRYLAQSGEHAVLEVVQPFFAWRALVVAHPLWYPDLSEPVRAALFHFIENVLDSDTFAPSQVNEYFS